MKKFRMLSALFALVLCLAGSVSAMAAGMNAEEEALLQKLKDGITVDGQQVTLPASYLNQAENELMKVDLSAEQADTLQAKIDEAAAVIQEEKITSPADLKKSARLEEVVGIAQEAAESVGYTVSFNASTKQVAVKDTEGNTVFETKNVINQTGFDFSSVLFAAAGFFAFLLAGVVVAGKKGLFAKAA